MQTQTTLVRRNNRRRQQFDRFRPGTTEQEDLAPVAQADDDDSCAIDETALEALRDWQYYQGHYAQRERAPLTQLPFQPELES